MMFLIFISLLVICFLQISSGNRINKEHSTFTTYLSAPYTDSFQKRETNFLKRPRIGDKKGIYLTTPPYNQEWYIFNGTIWKMTIPYSEPKTFGFCYDTCLSIADQELDKDDFAVAITSFNVATDNNGYFWFCHCWGQKLNIVSDYIYMESI
jgi:hypothetical protein